MIEVTALIVLVLTVLGLLWYLYVHQKEEREYIKKIQTDLTNLPIDLQKFYTDISAKDQARTQKLIGDSFKNYLKHIERLEKQVLPKPVTTKDVQSVMDRIGPMADETMENQIDKKTNEG